MVNKTEIMHVVLKNVVNILVVYMHKINLCNFVLCALLAAASV